jgi:hypothetical protein
MCVNKNYYTKEEAIQQLIDFYSEHGRPAEKKDFKKYNLKITDNYYYKHLGGLFKPLVDLGIIEPPLTENERIQISIKLLINLANKLQRCPTVEEFDEKKDKGYHRRNLEKHLNMKYNDICKTYIPQYFVNVNRDITKEEIIQSIFDAKEKLGRVPLYKEFKKFDNHFSYNAFKNVFGLTYNQVLESIGLIPLGSTTLFKDEVILLNDFYNLFIKLGRIPYCSDINNEENMASYNTYSKYFGSIYNISKLLNIDYNLFYKGAGAGKICHDKMNNLCKSIPEKEISNFLIDNNILFIKEPKYNEIIPNDMRKFDWKIVFNNKIYYIEYFGMYNTKPRGSIDRKYLYKVKKKIKDLYKSGHVNSCIFIFPDDYKNNNYIKKLSFLI